MSAANKITLSRIVLLPPLMALLAGQSVGMRWAALTLFLIMSASDWLDGYLARSRSEVTQLGKLLDPVADKLLVTATLLPLVHRELVADWVAVLLLGREFLVSGLRSVASAEGVVIPAGQIGKWKMGMSITALSFLIVTPRDPADTWPAWVPGEWYLWIGHAFLWLTLALSLWSAVRYFHEYRDALRTRPANPAAG